MTSVDHLTALLPDSEDFAALLRDIAAGAADRDRHDENPVDQVAALKRAGFGTLRLPAPFGGPGLTVPQLFSAVIDVAPGASEVRLGVAMALIGAPFFLMLLLRQRRLTWI